MLRLIDCIAQGHDQRLVALAAILCLVACYTAVKLVARAQVSNGRWKQIWIAATGIVIGGAIWSTHFVAMLGFRPEIPFRYDPTLTIVSILISIFCSWGGIALKLQFNRPLIGGAIVGLAIIAMHYAGMAALTLPGTLQWGANYIVVSILVGVIFGIFFSALLRESANRRLQMASGLCLVAAICGTHFISMAGIQISYNPTLDVPPAGFVSLWLGAGIFASTTMVMAMALLGVLIDHHLERRAVVETTRLRAHVLELEATRATLETTTQDLFTALDAAAASNRSKSLFPATMSHELRTPLNAIIGFSEILSTELFGPLGNLRYREYANDIKDSGAHLLALINDVLDFSKVDAGDLQLENDEVVLKQIIDESIRLLHEDASQAGVSLRGEVEANLPHLDGDYRRIRQVLLNLLSNSIKFTHSGGCIRVTAHYDGKEISLSVADTGIGIAATDIPKALERFTQVEDTLDRAYEGTGLGLPLSKRLIELHGGVLSVESELGVGTTVTMAFPADRTIQTRASA